MPNNTDVKKPEAKAPAAAPKAKSTTSKAPHNPGKNRIYERVPLSTSPKCKKVLWPRGTFGGA